MNKHALLHVQDSKFCFPTDDKTVILRLRTAREDRPEKIEVVYESKYLMYLQQKSEEMQRLYEDELFAYYEIRLSLSDVRLVYVFRIKDSGKEYYFSEDGLSEEYDFTLAYFNCFQLPYINAADVHEETEWMRSAVFYEIFTDRFCRGINKDKDYINMEWGEIPGPKSFAGGDIPGIILKLDYIKQLGVNAIYLTPIFCGISNHKYDISDYHRVDEGFGTNKDFKRLVWEAHRRGIRIVLDAVFNHCSELLPEFRDVVEKGKASEYYDWFIIKGDYPQKNPLNYEVFAFCSYMPKFNTSNPKVQDFLLDIASEWIEKYDIDGWRLDVSDEVSHDFWRMFRKRVKSVKKDAVIIGENWHDANSFLYGDQYDGIMNYAFTKACLDFFAFESTDAAGFAGRLNSLLMRNTEPVNNMMMNLLDSHDTDRFYTSVGKSRSRLLAAAAVMCMFVGAPCIYYGTELPLEGGYDPDNRRCFDWDAAESGSAFTALLKELLSLRSLTVVQRGAIKIEAVGELFSITRSDARESLRLFVNMSGEGTACIANGSVVTSHGYNAGLLDNEGYVVIRNGGNETA